jgi:HSP20 family protein
MVSMRWESLREYRSRAGQADRRGDSGWTPPADVSETEDAFIVVAELPGVRRADVDVAATHDTLTIRGHRPDPGCEPACYVRLERGHGQFVRRFTFPGRLSVDDVQADFRDGILTVTLPKSPETRGRRVEVG